MYILYQAQKAMDKAILGTPALKEVDMRLLIAWGDKMGITIRCLDGTLMLQDSDPKNDGTTFTLYATCPGMEEEHDCDGAHINVLVGSC